MSRLGVLVNPSAGHGRGSTGGRDAIAGLARTGHEVIDLSGPSAIEALAHARAALWEIDAVVVVGGDGMVHLGVNAVAGTNIPLGIVPYGSGNDFARCIGLPIHDVPAAVDVIVDALDRPPRIIDAIATRVHNPEAAPEQETAVEWTACILSAGFDAAVNGRANDFTWPKGEGRYLRGVAAELIRFRPYGYRLTIDGVVREQDATLVALANAKSFGGGIPIAPDAEVADGLIDVVIGDAMSRGQLIRLFGKLLKGNHLGDEKVHVVRAREVIMEALPGHNVPPQVFADGEPLGSLPIHARLRPGALRLLTPADA